jgi:hypothetical protein
VSTHTHTTQGSQNTASSTLPHLLPALYKHACQGVCQRLGPVPSACHRIVCLQHSESLPLHSPNQPDTVSQSCQLLLTAHTHRTTRDVASPVMQEASLHTHRIACTPQEFLTLVAPRIATLCCAYFHTKPVLAPTCVPGTQTPHMPHTQHNLTNLQTVCCHIPPSRWTLTTQHSVA